MLSARLIRWGAMATMLAGALSILIGALNAIEESNYSAVESTRWVLLAVALVGLYFYLLRSEGAGSGPVGHPLAEVGTLRMSVFSEGRETIFGAWANRGPKEGRAAIVSP